MRKTAYFTRVFAWMHAETSCFYEVLQASGAQNGPLGGLGNPFGGHLDTGPIFVSPRFENLVKTRGFCMCPC